MNVMNMGQRVNVEEQIGERSFGYVIASLDKEHKDMVQKTRFDLDTAKSSLLDHIQPRIVRLNESKHTNEVSDDGP